MLYHNVTNLDSLQHMVKHVEMNTEFYFYFSIFLFFFYLAFFYLKKTILDGYLNGSIILYHLTHFNMHFCVSTIHLGMLWSVLKHAEYQHKDDTWYKQHMKEYTCLWWGFSIIHQNDNFGRAVQHDMKFPTV